MIKRNPLKEVMEEAKEMTRRDKETFSAEEYKGKVGDPIELKKYVYVATEKAIKQGEVEGPPSKGTNEEVAKKLHHSRIGDLIKGTRDGITTQEVCKQKG